MQLTKKPADTTNAKCPPPSSGVRREPPARSQHTPGARARPGGPRGGVSSPPPAPSAASHWLRGSAVFPRARRGGMAGERAVGLVRELQRAAGGHLPPFRVSGDTGRGPGPRWGPPGARPHRVASGAAGGGAAAGAGGDAGAVRAEPGGCVSAGGVQEVPSRPILSHPVPSRCNAALLAGPKRRRAGRI